MKRVGNLWLQVGSFENLLGAAKDAARGKRSRADAGWRRPLLLGVCDFPGSRRAHFQES